MGWNVNTINKLRLAKDIFTYSYNLFPMAEEGGEVCTGAVLRDYS